MTNDKLFGIGLTLAGAVLLALYRISLRKVGLLPEDARPVESVRTAAINAVAATTLFGAFLLSGQPADIHPGFWTAVAISGTLNVFISALTIKALEKEEASLVVPIADTTPAAVVLVAMAVTGERPDRLGLLGIAFLVLGTYTLNIHELVDKLHAGKWSWRSFLAPFLALGRSAGIRLAFLASGCGVLSLSFDAVAARSAHPLFAVACIVAPSAVVHTGRAIAGGHAGQFFDRQRRMPWLGAPGFLFAGAVGIFFWSFRYLLVAYQATVKRTETVIVLVLAYLILNERKRFGTRAIAICAMVAGTLLIAR